VSRVSDASVVIGQPATGYTKNPRAVVGEARRSPRTHGRTYPPGLPPADEEPSDVERRQARGLLDVWGASRAPALHLHGRRGQMTPASVESRRTGMWPAELLRASPWRGTFGDARTSPPREDPGALVVAIHDAGRKGAKAAGRAVSSMIVNIRVAHPAPYFSSCVKACRRDPSGWHRVRLRSLLEQNRAGSRLNDGVI